MDTIGFKKRSDLHLARKLWHMCGVLLIAYFHNIVKHDLAIILLSVFSVVFIAADSIRIYSSKVNSVVIDLFRLIMRENEIHRFSGNTFLILGVFFINLFYPFDIVSLTLLFLAFADPLASYFGIKYGKTKILGSKSLEGFIAALVICFTLTFSFVYINNGHIDIMTKHLELGRIIWISAVAGLVGALSELIPIGKLDDNLTLPILSATGLFITFTIFGA